MPETLHLQSLKAPEPNDDLTHRPARCPRLAHWLQMILVPSSAVSTKISNQTSLRDLLLTNLFDHDCQVARNGRQDRNEALSLTVDQEQDLGNQLFL